MRTLRRLLRAIFRRGDSTRARDLQTELEFHIQMRARDLERQGFSAAEAWRLARIRFGNPTRQKETTWEATTMVWLESVLQDIRFSLRAMREAPLITAVAILSLALGIGANTAIFTVLDALLLRSLPVKDPRQVVTLTWVAPSSISMKLMRNLSGPYANVDDNTDTSPSFSFPVYDEFRKATSFSSLTGFFDLQNVSLTAGGRAEIARGQAVTGTYYETLGVAPILGRPFTGEDDRDTATPVCILSYRYWQSRFALDPAVIGQRVAINNVPYTIIGVEPRGFFGLMSGSAPDVTVPIRQIPKFETGAPSAAEFLDRTDWWVEIAGRLKPGVKRESAQAELQVLYAQSIPRLEKSPLVTLSREGQGLSFKSHAYRDPLLILMVVVAVVLLIACANVANLLLARAKSREKETAMRLALGAGRGRIARQLLTESILLAALGAAAGIGLAYWASGILASFNNVVIDVQPEIRVLAFTAAITVLTGLLFGLAPALRAARADLQPSLQRNQRAARFGMARVLVVAQLALSLVVLVGAGLYSRTLEKLRSVDLGINPSHLLVFRLLPGLAGYDNARATAFDERVLESLRHLPGVEYAAISRHIPLSGSLRSSRFIVPGKAEPLRNVSINLANEQFFQAMGIPLRLGRGIRDSDRGASKLVAVVNETFARLCCAGESPLGKHVTSNTMTDGTRQRDYEIVGVVRDSKYNEIRGNTPATVFLSYLQSPNDGTSMAFELRTTGDPMQAAALVRRAVAGIDSNVPVFNLATEEETIDGLLSQDRLFAGLSSAFGGLALILAAIGLYGVRAYSVARRLQEIGIRMALGAGRGNILRMILRETGWLALAGVAIGIASAYGLTRYVQSMLYGVAPRDFATFGIATAILLAVTALASFFPAHRASRVEPVVALRHE